VSVTSQRLKELQHQKEIIERWLQIPGIPTDAHAKLLQMLSEVNEQMKMNRFVISTKHRDDTRRLGTR
jgi:hypothetical protein